MSLLRDFRRVIALRQFINCIGVAGVADLLAGASWAGSDRLDDAVDAFPAVAACGREAVSVALGALAPHLPRYQRSLHNYARSLVVGG
jgi:hypothetical protein